MNTEFGELAQARYRARARRRRVYTVFGLVLVALGYVLMGVSPEASSAWAFTRAVAGIGAIVIGFGMLVVPWLSSAGNGE
ncbi:MAG: hypothetical protein ACT4NV_18915 [Rhodoferax sp.]